MNESTNDEEEALEISKDDVVELRDLALFSGRDLSVLTTWFQKSIDKKRFDVAEQVLNTFKVYLVESMAYMERDAINLILEAINQIIADNLDLRQSYPQLMGELLCLYDVGAGFGGVVPSFEILWKLEEIKDGEIIIERMFTKTMSNSDVAHAMSIREIVQGRAWAPITRARGLNQLEELGLVNKSKGIYSLTHDGLKVGLYLKRSKVRLALDKLTDEPASKLKPFGGPP
ncbi:MAG: hypothetical protein ACXAEL_06050 [Candidatus Hodarchaeales archaeon]|jgi:hypothetical protein